MPHQVIKKVRFGKYRVGFFRISLQNRKKRTMNPDERLKNILNDDPEKVYADYLKYFQHDRTLITFCFKRYQHIFLNSPTIFHVLVFYKAKNSLGLFRELELSDNIYSLDDEKRSVVHFAAAGGNVEFLTNEMNRLDINATDSQYLNLVQYAALYNKPEVLKWAIDNNLDVSRGYNDRIGPPIKIVCDKNYIRCIEILCENEKVRESLQSTRSSMPSSVLLRCLNSRLFEAMPFIMRTKMKLEYQRSEMWPLFFHGAAANNDAILEELIRRGININMKDPPSKWTALHVAASARSLINVKALIKYDADPFAKSSIRTTPFVIANSFSMKDKEMACATEIREHIKKRIALRFIDVMLENK